MKLGIRTTAFAAAVALAALGTMSTPLAAQTADEILDKHFAAIGGKDKIAAVQSAKITGKQQFGPQEAPFTIYWKRPNMLRMEFSLQGLTGIQAYDGSAAWQVMPFLGKNDPEAMTGDDLKSIIENADLIEGATFNYKQKGHQVELIGKESVEGTDAWKLKLTRDTGDVDYVYLEAESMLQMKSEAKRKRGEQEIEMETAIGDYKEVGGLMFAHSIENKMKGMPQGSTITVETIELGATIDDALFAMPAKTEAKPSGN